MKEDKIFIAGHRGMVGTAIHDLFIGNGYLNIVTRSSGELDLRNQKDVEHFISKERPATIILAAARVGGILANDRYPYDFLYDNLTIQSNVMNAAHRNNVDRLIFLGSSCIYPKHALQPIKEEYLLTGALEPTNQWYAIAKIAGIKLCQALNRQYGRNYTTLMPTNLYGPRDNFDLETSHVVAAMIRKFHEAKEKKHAPVTLWGTGSPKREFLYVQDLADAVLFVFEHGLKRDMYNVGSGKDLSIKQLAQIIQHITGHQGEIRWDATKPDGTPRKLLDVSRLSSEGWHYTTDLEAGLTKTYQQFKEKSNELRTVNI